MRVLVCVTGDDVSGGMLTDALCTIAIAGAPRYKYQVRADYVDKTTSDGQIAFMRYCPALQRILVCEEGRCVHMCCANRHQCLRHPHRCVLTCYAPRWPPCRSLWLPTAPT